MNNVLNDEDPTKENTLIKKRKGNILTSYACARDMNTFLNYTYYVFNDKVHYSSNPLNSNIVRVIKSRRMRWTGHVACMGEERRDRKSVV